VSRHLLFTKEQAATLVERYVAREPIKVIAAKFGCSMQTVMRYARKAGVPMRKPRIGYLSQ
jgi:DNA-directed RNA polymerase specialized sigma24 family protein